MEAIGSQRYELMGFRKGSDIDHGISAPERAVRRDSIPRLQWELPKSARRGRDEIFFVRSTTRL